MTVKSFLISCLTMALLAGGTVAIFGCGTGGGGGLPGNGNGNGNGGNGNGGNGNGNGGNGGPSTVTGDYNPEGQLLLATNGVSLTIPPGATFTPVTVSLQSASNLNLPSPLPGGVNLTGGSFGPDGLQLLVPATVIGRLSTPTIAEALPVLTYDTARNRWVGTGISEVTDNGLDATFELNFFALTGVPDPLPLPPQGDPIDVLVAIPNNGTFMSTEISSDTASLFYSESAGGSMNIEISSTKVDEFGQPRTRELSLFGIQVSTVGNRVVAEIGGPGSSFNDGGFLSPSEPVLGAVVMSVTGQTVSATVYVATPDRVIFGTLEGPAG